MNDVIRVDVTGMKVMTLAQVDEIFDELESLARKVPDRYAIICWRDVEIGSAAVAQHYGARTIVWQRALRGVFRYAAADPVVRSYIRTESLKHQKQGMRSNLLDTEGDALEAVRDARAKDPR